MNRPTEIDYLLVVNVAALLLGAVLVAQPILGVKLSWGDQFGELVGNDFFCFWSAGRMALDGHVLDIFNPKVLAAFQQNYLKAPSDFSVLWFYPPLLLLHISCIFAILPYKLAYFLYLLISFTAYYGLTRRYFPAAKPLYIMAFPGFWFNVLMGQNGLLTAVILIAGLIQLTKSPTISGVVFALLSYKPHLCLAVPLYLIVERRFQTIVIGAAALSGMVAFSVAVYGTAAWFAFFEGIREAQNFNHLGETVKFASFAHLYGSLRILGFNHALAMQLNYAFVAVASIAAMRIWIYSGDQFSKYSTMILMTILLPPHLTYYDLVVTGAVILWLWPQPSLRPGLALLWVAPFLWPSVGALGVPMVPVAAALLLVQLNKGLSAARTTPSPGLDR
jgi:Glycosyltransferase family 87